MRVLVVDDERSMSASLKRGLEAEGYIVDVAEDGSVGLWMATEFDYDAVVLDVMLPGLNGFLVARRLREAGRTIRTPVANVAAALDVAQRYPDGADRPAVAADVASQNQRMGGWSTTCCSSPPPNRAARPDRSAPSRSHRWSAVRCSA